MASIFSVFVNTEWDFTFGVLTHNVLNIPAVPVPTPMISVEMLIPQKWVGFFANQAKFTSTVTYGGQNICVKDHNIGMLIPDITPPIMANIYYVIMWPFSERKIAFTASTVKMDGAETGCAETLLVPLPMMTCGDPITAPTALVLTNALTSSKVKVGMSLMDLIMGLIGIAISIAIDYVFERFWPGGGDVMANYGRRAVSREVMTQVAQTATMSVGRTLFREALGKFGGTAKSAVKRGVSALAGLATSTFEGNPTFKYGLGAPPFLGGDVVVDRTGLGGTSEAAGVNVNTAGEANAWGEPL